MIAKGTLPPTIRYGILKARSSTKMNLNGCITKFIILATLIASTFAQLDIIRDLVQFNIAGIPVLHKDQKWPFDPDVGHRRSRQYQEVNGYLGERAIERLGLGIDGYDRERLQQQRLRDVGHLGGVDR